MTERFEVQRRIPAEAGTIFDVLRSPQGHVAIDASGMLQGATGEPVEGGTLVTSIYDWSSVSERLKPEGRWPIIQESALKATLGILERTVRGWGPR